jgi:hypothetical protein
MLTRVTPGHLISFLVVALTVAYAAYQADPYIVLGITPFFLLGCARGKRPLSLIALAALPSLFLVLGSVLKLHYTGLPLSVLDRYLVRDNLLVLAFNDYRVAAILVAIAIAAAIYFTVLFWGRGPFSLFERAVASVFICGSVMAVASLHTSSLDFLMEQVHGNPSFKTFMRSILIPGAQLRLASGDDVSPVAVSHSLGAPAGGRPDLFFILQESAFDPQRLDPEFESRALFSKEQRIAGPLHVHSIGGGTWLAEFSLVTQMRPQEFGDGGWYVFHQMPGRIKKSLFTQLKELGYRSIVIYPVPGFFLNARQFYKSIGVDEFLDVADLGVGKGWDWRIPDADFYTALRARLQAMPQDQPVAVLLLTINQHGPHSRTDPVGDYLARYAQSDAAYEDFLGYLTARGRMAGVVAFGDHLPEFATQVFDDDDRRELTNYEIRCIHFSCEDVAGYVPDQQIDVTLLAPLALEHFGFEMDGLSRYKKSLFAHCASDVSRCAEELRLRFNRAFSVVFQ